MIIIKSIKLLIDLIQKQNMMQDLNQFKFLELIKMFIFQQTRYHRFQEIFEYFSLLFEGCRPKIGLC